MSGASRKLMAATAAAELLAVEDCFSCFLYTGNGSTQTITNGIDLAGEGGLVWIKSRSAATDNFLFDTIRGTTKEINSNSTAAEATLANSLTAFNANGFSIGSATGIGVNAATYASWTFRKAPRFFDVVTYAGDAQASKVINHNLGVVPGFIIVKPYSGTSAVNSWSCYHRGVGNTAGLSLNLTDVPATAIQYWRNTDPTSTTFTVGSVLNDLNTNFVAYLFAHDPLGPSGDGSDGLIACGLHTQAVTGANELINLGWEPQWVLTKRIDSANDWILEDNMRGFLATGNSSMLRPNLSNAEGLTSTPNVTSNGFIFNTTAGQQHIYIAIRRGPMREPTSGTQVFALDTQNSGSYSSPPYYRSGFVTDAALRLYRTGGSSSYQWFASRLTGPNNLVTSSTAAEVTNSTTNSWDYMGGWGGSGASSSTTAVVSPMFRRAPGFFDVVAYTGTGSIRTVSHNLGVAPQMMIVKNRTTAGYDWPVYHAGLNVNGDGLPETDVILLNSSNAALDAFIYWGDTAPTDTNFTLGGGSLQVNGSANNYIAYLFASLPGISKVGSYTGNGSTQTIDCGFTAGARFVLIKRTDTADAWYVWDSARGIVAGNDPYLQLNSTAAEVTSTDHIDPANSGFTLATGFLGTNNSAGTYIYLAIA